MNIFEFRVNWLNLTEWMQMGWHNRFYEITLIIHQISNLNSGVTTNTYMTTLFVHKIGFSWINVI